MSRHLLFVLPAALMLFVGCNQSGRPDAADDTGGSNTTADNTNATDNDALEGRWMMIAGLFEEPMEIPLAVVDIARGSDGQLAAEVVYSHDDYFPEAQVAEFKAGDGRMSLRFELPIGGQLDVEAIPEKNVIRGNAPTNSGVQPIRLLRTRRSSVFGEEPRASDGAETFVAAMQSDAPAENLRQFVKQFADSPAALTACIELIKLSRREQLGRTDVEQDVANFVRIARRWGPRMEQTSRARSALLLVRQRYLPELALEIIRPLEETLSDEEAQDVAPQLEYTRAVAQLFSRDETNQKIGAAGIRRLNRENLFNHRYRAALAEYSERTGATDEALRLFAEVAVLPGGEAGVMAEQPAGADDEAETPSAAVARLWRAKHGDTDGLDAYLDEVYTNLIHGVAADAEPVASRGTRVTLCELFTGAACPPCVAADVATTGLEVQYDKSRVIVLRYHIHIPLPDPMSNADSETRFDYYQGLGTPTVLLNGRLEQDVVGPISLAPLQFQRLRESVDELVKQDSRLRINLAAEAKDGQLHLNAQVGGADEMPSTLRLRLALVEDSVDFVAPNGIRKHEMVVRNMPGGPEGIAADQGRLKFTGTIPLASLRKDLVDYLDRYEQQFDLRFAPPELIEQLSNGVFPQKPLELKPLHFVAFVQDDATRDILQAAAVPVSGKLEYPATTSSTSPATGQNVAERPVEAPLP